jgi:hypothetical protein
MVTIGDEAFGKIVVTKYGHQFHFMSKKAKVLGNVACHAAMMKSDVAGNACHLRYNRILTVGSDGNIDVSFSYYGDIHFRSK